LKSVIPKLMSNSKENFIYIIIGALCAIINGTAFPFFNIAFSNIMALLALA